MKQMIKIIRKSDVQKQHERELLVEQDYWLGSLHVAVQDNDLESKAEALEKLKSLGRELEMLRYQMKEN